MPKTKLRHKSTSDTKEARLAAAENFTKGVRVRYTVTGKQGVFQELNLGFALPEVWIQFESDSEISVPTSCNPLDLELIDSNGNQHEEILLGVELSKVEEIPVATVEVLEELTQQEAAERHRLEIKVERAFYEAAIALRELHDRRLHRSTHSRFDHYCRDRFGFSQQNADLLIRAAKVIDNLKVTTIGCNFLPTSERQVRPLTKLEPDLQRKVWQQAVEASGNKVPSGRIVTGIVEQLKEKLLFPATDFCQIGDVFTLARLEGEQRKYNNYPCVAVELKHFTVVIDVHDTTLAVKPENLKPIDAPDAHRQLPQILRRIKRLRNVDLLDRGAYYILEGLGRQTYLTDLEADLLAFLEQRYGIED